MEMLSASAVAAAPFAASDAPSELGLGFAWLLDELAYGVVVVDLKGRVLHANQAARHELDRARLVLEQHATLQARRPEHGKALLEAISKVAEGKRSMLTLANGSDAELSLAILPLKGGPSRGAPRAVLLFARASICESLMLGFFARSHGLTGTEEHVLGILCHGYSVPEVAQQMKLAVSTIRSHVRSLCAKTNSSGVRQLVNRLAVLPPVVPALRYEQVH